MTTFASSEALFARPSAPPSSVAHLAYLDGFRAIAATYVVAGHALSQVWPQPLPYASLHGVRLVLTLLFGHAHYAVSVFIVLSGFCLMLPIARGDGTLRGGALTFFRRRARRILPPYYLAAAISLLLIATVIGKPSGTHWDVTIPVTRAGLLEHLLLVQNFHGSPQINHVFWSIAVEWQIYFLFPLLVWMWSRTSPILVVGAAAVLAFFAQSVLQRIAPDASLHYIALFAMGMLGAAISFARDARLTVLRERTPWRLLILLALPIAEMTLQSHGYIVADYFVGLAMLILLLFASREGESRLRAALSIRPFVWVGGFAYSLYLIHAPILQLVTVFVTRPLHVEPSVEALATLLVGTPICIGGAWLFHRTCEKPFIPSTRSSDARKPATAAA